jgi:hypothetical protein
MVITHLKLFAVKQIFQRPEYDGNNGMAPYTPLGRTKLL